MLLRDIGGNNSGGSWGNAIRRFTRQRAAVYNYLRDSDQHPTAEEVFSAVKSRIPRISLATVYKALDALVASRLARKTRM
jgi:Fur family transcriptional regulator, peroxide stress response regulator